MTPPTRYALVPAIVTTEMFDSAARAGGRYSYSRGVDFEKAYPLALAASPNGGCVTAEKLERAAEIIDPSGAWYLRLPSSINAHGRDLLERRAAAIEKARLVLTALGLTVASEPTPAATEEGR